MMKPAARITLFVGLFVLSLFCFLSFTAKAQSVGFPTQPINVNLDSIRQLLTPEVTGVLIFFLAGQITTALTTIFKDRLDSSGNGTKTISFVVTTLLAGVLPFALGWYGYTVTGFVYAVVVAVLRAITDQGLYKTRVNQNARALLGPRTERGDQSAAQSIPQAVVPQAVLESNINARMAIGGVEPSDRDEFMAHVQTYVAEEGARINS